MHKKAISKYLVFKIPEVVALDVLNLKLLFRVIPSGLTFMTHSTTTR